MDNINKKKITSEFMGLRKLKDSQKINLFNIVNNYQSILFFLKNKMGLFFADWYLSGVLGVLAFRSEKIEKSVHLANLILDNDNTKRNDYFENFDWTKISEIDLEFEKAYQNILKLNTIQWWTKIYIGARYSDWGKIVFGFAKWFLIVFLLFSLLYFLVATEWGRDLSWRLLDVYGYIARIMMILLLVVALIVIVVLVSFMYFERKNNK